jgi:hypothetical protein
MHYDFIAIPDADVPQAVDPTFQYVLATYASETNKTVIVWRAGDVRDCKNEMGTLAACPGRGHAKGNGRLPSVAGRSTYRG